MSREEKYENRVRNLDPKLETARLERVSNKCDDSATIDTASYIVSDFFQGQKIYILF